MIQTFYCKDTEAVFHGKVPAKFGNLSRICHRKLLVLNAIKNVSELRSPPNNKYEALKAAGWHAFRVNDRWRVVFQWHDGNAYNVQIIDYH